MKLKRSLTAILAGLLVASSAALAVSALEPHGTGIKCRNWLTNDPNYTFSDSYKESVWYKNFSELELSDNQRNNILAIAVSQLGYHEGEDGDYSGTNTTSSGNCVEYFRLLIPNWSNNSDEWCACFVNWCLNQARIDYASSEISCWKWVGELKTMKMFQNSAAYNGTYTPKPADMIFFNWNNVNTGSSHIGYVLYTTETEVYTIEGNANNNVTIRSYALNDPCVIGYGTPPYEEGETPTVDHSYAAGMPRGRYVVNSTGINLKETPESSGRICRVPLGSLVTLIGVDDTYAHVYFEDKEGYIPKSNLYLMAELVGEDTLTYNANGGQGAPADAAVPYGQSVSVSQDIPTLEGDTFLGWSLVPHNYKVDYEPGDPISLAGNTTLYAVWEKRSFELATDKLAEGNVAEFERPETITNTGALLVGTLDKLTAFDTTAGDSTISYTQDDEVGKALAIVSDKESSDPFITLDYATLCGDLQLAPVSADNVDYIILKVKDVSMYNVFLELYYDCGDGMKNSVSKLLQSGDGWQYVVLDMTAASGFEGELQKLRIDWEKASDDAGNLMLLEGIYFAANEAQRDAIVKGQYIFPVQPIVEIPETETETEPVTLPETDPATETPAVSDAESNKSDAIDSSTGSNDATAGTEGEGDKDNGCSSLTSVAGLVTLIVAATGAALITRRRDD